MGANIPLLYRHRFIRQPLGAVVRDVSSGVLLVHERKLYEAAGGRLRRQGKEDNARGRFVQANLMRTSINRPARMS